MERTYWEVWPWQNRCGLVGGSISKALEYQMLKLCHKCDILSLLPADPYIEFSAPSVLCLPTQQHTSHHDDKRLNP